jgi:hypothetical protein
MPAVRGAKPTGLLAKLEQVFRSLPFLGLVVALFTFPTFSLTPAPGLDLSWGAGLQMATHDGLVFGRDVIFTYGPLGFLSVPTLWYQDLGAAAVAYAAIVHILACTLVLWAALRIFDRLLAVVVAVFACSFLGSPLVTIALILAASVAAGRARPRLRAAFPPAIGVLAGFALLLKLNLGIEILLLGGLTLLADRPRRAVTQLAQFGGAFVAALILFWLAAGQPLGALPDYIALSESVISGHSEAMVLSDPGSASAALLAIGAGVAATVATWLLNDDLVQRRRLVLTGLIALFAFVSFKEGFIRPDRGHIAFFISAMVAAWFVLGWKRPLGWPGIVSLLAVLAASANFSSGAIDPIAHIKAARDLTRTMISPSRRHSATDVGRSNIEANQAIDPAIVAAIGSRPVHVSPYETSVAWAYGLKWRPLPVFQDYLAFTPKLDQENTDALRSTEAPPLILRELDTGLVDGRYIGFNPPEATVEMLCRYSPSLTRGNWVLLRRTRDRCGREKLLKSTDGEFGKPFTVPAVPLGSLTVVRVRGVGVGGLERLRTLLFRAKPRYVGFSGGNQSASTAANFRLVPGTAEDGLLISAPRGADYPQPFTLAPDPAAFTISGPGLEGPIDIDFYTRPIRPGTTAAQSRPGGTSEARKRWQARSILRPPAKARPTE